MNSYFTNAISLMLPPTRWFAFKRFLYRKTGIRLGERVAIGNCIKIFSQGEISLGSDVWLGRGAEFTVPSGAKVTIGSCVDIGPNVRFACGTHDIGSSTRRAGLGRADSIVIGSGVWIGAEVLILGGGNIGDSSIVAAGSVVLPGTYPPNVLLAGIPARVVKTLPASP